MTHNFILANMTLKRKDDIFESLTAVGRWKYFISFTKWCSFFNKVICEGPMTDWQISIWNNNSFSFFSKLNTRKRSGPPKIAISFISLEDWLECCFEKKQEERRIKLSLDVPKSAPKNIFIIIFRETKLRIRKPQFSEMEKIAANLWIKERSGQFG